MTEKELRQRLMRKNRTLREAYAHLRDRVIPKRNARILELMERAERMGLLVVWLVERKPGEDEPEWVMEGIREARKFARAGEQRAASDS